MADAEIIEPRGTHLQETNYRVYSKENDDPTARQFQLEQLASQATARLNEALFAINQAIKMPEPLTAVKSVLGSPFHPRTGKIRKAREKDSSDDERFVVESSDEETHLSNSVVGRQGMAQSPGTLQRRSTSRRGRLPSAKSSSGDTNTNWVASTNGRYGVNKPKCPPCARLKKKDPCNGQAPCRQCWGKGRRTPEECQEWGEGYVPKVRKRRGRKSRLEKCE